MWPTGAELQGWTRVVEARNYVGITDAPLQALLERLGAWDPSKNMEDQPMRLHMLAQMHPSVVGELNWNVAIATGSPDPEGRVPYRRATNYESLQLDLIYRIARRKMGQEDTDPYGAWLQMHTAAANYDPQYGGRVQQQANNQWAQGGAWAPPAPPPQAVAAQKLIVGDFLVQGDKNEIPGIVLSDVRRWRGNWALHSPGGREPDADIDPSNEQLTALNWRLVTGGTLYADFALWTPINNRLVHVRKFSTFRQTEVGTWEKIEVKGPGSFMQWRYCWRVFRTAAIMLDAISSGTLDAYERWVEKLANEFVDQDGAIWGFLYKVEDRARSEYAARLR